MTALGRLGSITKGGFLAGYLQGSLAGLLRVLTEAFQENCH
jgi:hypothetical protein